MADQKLDELSVAGSLLVANLLYLTQAGNPRKVTLGDLLTAGVPGAFSDLSVDGKLILAPSDLMNVTAAGGIAVTDVHMRVQGDGAPVTITADPQIAPGTDGEIIILEGGDNVNTVTLREGNGLRLHGGKAILGAGDVIMFYYDVGVAAWEEINRNFPASEKSFSFLSKDAGARYYGGYYIFQNGDDDFSSAITFGLPSVAYAAHFFIVLGETTEDEVTITVTGTSITDRGIRTPGDTQDIVIPHPSATNAYFETSKKWLGRVSIEITGGTAKPCNYGYCKYWDNNNTDFRVLGFDCTWNCGKSDDFADIKLHKHRSDGWAYNAGNKPVPPTSVATMRVDHGTWSSVRENVPGAWKRDNLDVFIAGGDSEGTILEVVTSEEGVFDVGNFLLRIRPN